MAKSIQGQAQEIVDSYLEGNSIDDEGLVEAIASALREVAREQREQQKEADAVIAEAILEDKFDRDFEPAQTEEQIRVGIATAIRAAEIESKE